MAAIALVAAAGSIAVPWPLAMAGQGCGCDSKIRLVPAYSMYQPKRYVFEGDQNGEAGQAAKALADDFVYDRTLEGFYCVGPTFKTASPGVEQGWVVEYYLPGSSDFDLNDPALKDKSKKCDPRDGKPPKGYKSNEPGEPTVHQVQGADPGCAPCQQQNPSTESPPAPPPYEQIVDIGAGHNPSSGEPMGRLRFDYDFSEDQQLPNGLRHDQFEWDGFESADVDRDANDQWIESIRVPSGSSVGTMITLAKTLEEGKVIQVVVTTSSLAGANHPNYFPTRTTTYDVEYPVGVAKVTVTDSHGGGSTSSHISGEVSGSSFMWETVDFSGESTLTQGYVSGGQKTVTTDVITPNSQGHTRSLVTRVYDTATSKILSETDSSGGVSQVTQYSYWTGTGTPKDGKLKSIAHPDGSWVAYVDYDAQGRVIEILRPWLDEPATPALGLATPNLCLREVVSFTRQTNVDPLPATSKLYTDNDNNVQVRDWALPAHSREEHITSKGGLVIRQSVSETVLISKSTLGAFPTRQLNIPYDGEFVIARSTLQFDPASGHQQGSWELSGLTETFDETNGYHYEGTISSSGLFTYREYLPLNEGSFPSVSGSTTLSNATRYYRETYRDVDMSFNPPKILAVGPPEKVEVWLDENGNELARVTKVGTTVINLVETTYDATGATEQRRNGTGGTAGFMVNKNSAPVNTTLALNPPTTATTEVYAVTETDAEGNTTKIYRDSQTDEEVRTEHLTAGTGSIVLTTSNYFDPVSRTYTHTETAGSPVTLKRVSTRQIDQRGRIVAVTNVDGSTATFEYSTDGLLTTERRPGSVSIETRMFVDGRLKSVTGNGTTAQHYSYDIVDLGGGVGGVRETVRTGSSDSLRMSTTLTNPLGQTIQQTKPAPPQMDGLTGGTIAVTTVYDEAGRVVKKAQTGMATRLYKYSRTAGTGAEVTTEALDLSEDVNVSAGNNEIDEDGADIVTVRSAYYELTPELYSVRKTSVLKAGPAGESKDTYVKEALKPHYFEKTLVIDADGSKTSRSVSITPGNATTQGVSTEQVHGQASGANDWTLLRTATYRDGLLRSEITAPATVATNYAYDGLRRRTTVSVTPAGSGRYQAWSYDLAATVTKDFNLTQVQGETNANGGKLTTYAYDMTAGASYGRVKSMTTESGVVYYEYDTLGRLTYRWGTAEAPVAFTYAAGTGEMISMKTYQNTLAEWSASTKPAIWDTAASSTTGWTYDPASGALVSKSDAAGKSVTYLYDRAGRVISRKNARNIVTEYGYDGAGRPAGRVYSDGTTPRVVMQYSKGGDLTSLEDAAGLHTFVTAATGFDDVTETVSPTVGDWKGLSFASTRSWDTSNRRQTELMINDGATAIYSTKRTQLWDGAMESVQGLGIRATYARNNFGQVTGTATSEVSGSGYTTFGANDILDTSLALTYDLGRVETIRYAASGAAAVKQGWTYGFNAAWQRTTVAPSTAGRIGWIYTYNTDGSVATANRRNFASSPAANVSKQNWSYQYDAIGNRKSMIRSAATRTYAAPTSTPKDGTQYGVITNPLTVDISGQVSPTAAVTVTLNNLAAGNSTGSSTLVEAGTYYREFNIASPQTAPRWIKMNATVGTAGPSQAKSDGWFFYRGTNEALTYDEDGNLTGDARWIYSWDAENRLIAMEEKDGIAGPSDGTPPPARLKLVFNYDAHSRRTSKKVYILNGSNWDLQSHLIFLYEKWNLVAELDALKSNRMLRRYVWGPDLSGNMEGAGGVGGLLFVENAVDSWTSGTTTIPGVRYAVQNDGNGNVMGLVTLDGPKERTLAGRFDYDTFGNRVTNTMAQGLIACPIGFSSKYEDLETGLLYYGFRYYSPEMGRWISRDPLGDRVFLVHQLTHEPASMRRQLTRESLRPPYLFVGNSPLNQVDRLGLNGWGFDPYGRPWQPGDPFDGKHPTVSACSLGQCCAENMRRLYQWVEAASIRRGRDFTDYWKKNGNEKSWEGHRTQFINAWSNAANCIGIILQQVESGQCSPRPPDLGDLPDYQKRVTKLDDPGPWVPFAAPSEPGITDWEYWEEATGLSGTALLIYIIVSEGTRVIPWRNAVPVL